MKTKEIRHSLAKKSNTPPLKVAYVLLRFPQLTETFIADEIQALRSQNVEVEICSLLQPDPGPIQSVSRQLLRFTSYSPGPLGLSLWSAQFHFLLKSFRLYMHLLRGLMLEPDPGRSGITLLKRLTIFLKAVQVAHRLEAKEIQLIHAHFAWLPGAAAWICARLLGVPFTVTAHAYDIFSSKKDLLTLVCREASQVITISEFNRNQIGLLTACPSERISVIHCGVDLASFRPRANAANEPGDFGPLRILSVGSLVAKKGHALLIAACQQLSIDGIPFTCSIIGGGPDESELRRQIQSYGLQDQVRLLGGLAHPEIMRAYYEHDIFVLASRVAPDGDRDGIPVVLMEAGMAGLPLISTTVSGIPEVVRHKQTGWLVPPDNVTALAHAIKELAGDPRQRSRLAVNAHALIRSEFDIEVSATKLSKLFDRIRRHPPKVRLRSEMMTI